jgi:hypothetical protein
MRLHARTRVEESDFLFDGGVMFSLAHLRFFGVFTMASNGWCTAHCSLDALPLCFPSASPLLVIVSLAPHRPASPVPIDIRDSSGIGLRSLKFDSCRDLCCSGFVLGRNCDLCDGYRTHLEGIWLYWSASGTHVPRKRMVSRGRFSFQRRWRDIW